MSKGKEAQVNFWLELFVRESCNLLIFFVHHIVGGIKYSDIKLSYQGELFVRVPPTFSILKGYVDQHVVVHGTSGLKTGRTWT